VYGAVNEKEESGMPKITATVLESSSLCFYQFHICLYKPLTDLKVILSVLSYFFECTEICNIIHSLKIKT